MRTRLVKTRDELARYLKALERGQFLDTRRLTVTFETDPEVVAELLPPPLRPADRPQVDVSIGQTRRANCGPYDGGHISLACQHEGVQGLYSIAMAMNADTAIIYGRELYGEPKKLADVGFERDGRWVRASLTRRGITYVEIEGSFEGEPEGPSQEGTGYMFHFRYQPDPTGGITRPVDLIRVRSVRTVERMMRGTGIVTFRESQHDPLIDIPVHAVVGATYSEGGSYAYPEVIAQVPAEQYLPYAFAKTDCFPLFLETDLAAAR